MNGFVDLHGESITGVIETFDRVIFKGHLNGFFPDGAFGRYLSRRSVLLKDAGRFFEAETQRIRDHVVSLAAAAGRPVEYLTGSSTHRSGSSKEARARAIAERDGVREQKIPWGVGGWLVLLQASRMDVVSNSVLGKPMRVQIQLRIVTDDDTVLSED